MRQQQAENKSAKANPPPVESVMLSEYINDSPVINRVKSVPHVGGLWGLGTRRA
jgi:hypothetical protein